MKYGLIIIIAILYARNSFAQRTTFKGDTQTEMNIDAIKSYEKRNKKMMSLYRKILEMYKNDTLMIRNLKKSQRIWAKWIDAEIESYYPNYPNRGEVYGTMQPLCYYSKLMDWTDERIRHFQLYLKPFDSNDLCAPAAGL